MPDPADVVLEHFRRMYEDGDLDAAGEFFDEDYLNHEAAPRRSPGVGGRGDDRLAARGIR